MNWRVNSMVPRYPGLGRALRIVLTLGILALGNAPGVAKPKKTKKDPTPAPTVVDDAFDVPIPINHDAKGVHIPIYGLDGTLQMMFESEIAFRVDLQQLRLTQLKIETYDEAGKPDMAIEMPQSIYDLKTKVLSSVDPVTIRRNDFELTGAHMTFDTQTRLGKFTGPVRMLVFNMPQE